MTERGARGVFYTDGSTNLNWEQALEASFSGPTTPGTQPPLVEGTIPINVDIPDDATDDFIRAAVRAQIPSEAPEHVVDALVASIREKMPVPVVVATTESVQVSEGMTTEDVLAALPLPAPVLPVVEEVSHQDEHPQQADILKHTPQVPIQAKPVRKVAQRKATTKKKPVPKKKP